MAFGFSATSQSDFMEDLVSMMKDGIRLDAALDEIANTFGGRFAVIARRLKNSLTHGKPIADGMSGTFDPVLVDAARAGEAGGRFEEAVFAGVELLRARSETIRQLRKALTYPIISLIIVCGLVVMLSVAVLPEVARLVPPSKWTPLGRTVIESGDFIVHYGIFVLLIIGGAIYMVVRSFSSLTGEIRSQLDEFPPWSFYRAYQAATFMQNLSLLLRCGLMFKDALNLIARHSSPYVAWHVRQMLYRLARPEISRSAGTGASANAMALDTGLILDKYVRRMRLISQTSEFENALDRLGRRTTKDVTELMDSVRMFLSNIMLVISGLALSSTVLGLFQTLQRIM
jgi:type II secretory pathway component PulF